MESGGNQESNSESKWHKDAQAIAYLAVLTDCRSLKDMNILFGTVHAN
jgi:hypothetical protein